MLKKSYKDLNEEHVAGPSHPLVDEDTATVTQLLTSVLEEVKELRKERSNLASELQKLNEVNSFLTETVGQHQRFLEALDGEKRSQNLIITGVPEDIPLVESNRTEESATADNEKVSVVLKQIGHKDLSSGQEEKWYRNPHPTTENNYKPPPGKKRCD